MPGPFAMPHDRELTLCQDYRSGKIIAELARDYSTSCKTVLNILRRHGVPRRPKGKPRVEGRDPVPVRDRTRPKAAVKSKIAPLPTEGVFWGPTRAQLMGGR